VLYISDSGNNRIRKVDLSGIITTVAGTNSQGYFGDGGLAVKASLNQAGGICLDAAGNLFIADTDNQRIREVNTNGIIFTVAGNGGFGYSGDGRSATSASLYYPAGVAVDAAGDVYIADTTNHRVRKVNTFGVITTIAGNGTAGFSGDGGPAIGSSLEYPYDVALNAAGNAPDTVSL
jgi:sugar lactone lactonase YvrE